MRKEENFTTQEQHGYDLFKIDCACHKEPLFTDDKFEKNGLEIDESLNDLGRIKITNKPGIISVLKFNIRNIQFTFPYMRWKI